MGNQEEKTKKKFYKKWWFWALIVLFVIIVASADNDKPQKISDGSEPTTNNQAQNKTEQESFKVGDQVKMGSSVITVNNVEYSQGGQYSKPNEGNEWINLNITIENNGSSQQYVTTLGQMFIKDGDRNSYQVSVTDKSKALIIIW